MKKKCVLLFLCSLLVLPLVAEDGSRLWLPAAPEMSEDLSTLDIARCEMALLPVKNALVSTAGDRRLRRYISKAELRSLGEEEFIVRTVDSLCVVAGGSERAALYGVYRLMRDYASGCLAASYDIREKPSYELRLLNHWDNLDGSVERGYAGRSIWWEGDTLRPACTVPMPGPTASVGINGTVLNNVNASPRVLDSLHLDKVRQIADLLRPYGMKVYLSINFSSPMALGGLPTADPLDARVAGWWRDKVKEIYGLIPDFGGFLVKANSEGLPGPQDYGRTHADGANMLADALAPYDGVVMWRAFVYNPTETDRAKQAYTEFLPLDSLFRDNVIIQVKNGPVDFQPREPFSPLFGAMRHTPVMPEFQITQEYLGFSNHLAYLAPLYEECLDSDTYVDGPGSTVARVTVVLALPLSLRRLPVWPISVLIPTGAATILPRPTGTPSAGWRGATPFRPRRLPGSGCGRPFSHDDRCVVPLKRAMMLSREAVVDYMMPLGLHHLFAFGHHYGPEPWGYRKGMRPDWLPSYYHRADSAGIGFDRTQAGSDAVSQYAEPLRSIYNDAGRCPESLLLWFHHLPWNHVMASQRTLWDELCLTYQRGVDSARELAGIWQSVAPYIDAERFAHVEARLRVQLHDAVWWKDACLLYFQTFSRLPFPAGVEPPVYTLDELKRIKLDMKHHN